MPLTRRLIFRRWDYRTLRPANTVGCSANTDGTFSFEQQPGKPVRFYGVNLCFSAHYITHDQSDQLAERLARLGYNTVRLHHYESELTDRSPDRTQLNAEKLDQLDYLIAAFIKRGIYVTTDLFVSRPVDIARLAPDFAGSRGNAMNSFKVLAALQPAGVRELEDLRAQSAHARQSVHAAFLRRRACPGLVVTDQ